MNRRCAALRPARGLALAALLAAAGPASAHTAGMTPGAGLTLGSVSHPHALGAGANPAALPRTPGIDLNLLQVGVAGELGPVDSLIDELDDLQDLLEEENLDPDFAQEAEGRFNAFLEQAGRDGYAKLTGAASVPLTPVRVRSPVGEASGISFDVRFTGQGRLDVLDAPVELEAGDTELSTDTALSVKGAEVREVTAGYGRRVLRNDAGELQVGGTLTHYQAKLSKIVFRLEDTDDVGDTVTEEFDSNQRTTSELGAGLGLLWTARNYQVGATARNLNKPEFDFPAIGEDCGDLDGDDRERCEAAEQFAERIDREGTWTLDPQMTLEGALYTEDRTWVLAGSVDVSDVDDPVGDEVQWAAVSVSTDPRMRLMPSWRFGYRENLSGTERRYVTTGLSLFRALDLDIAYDLDSVEFDEEDYPRSLWVNLGLRLSF